MYRTMLALFVLASLATTVAAQEKVNTETFMRMKLTHAQSVLEGLAMEDYDMISKHAQAMILLSHESNWSVIQSPAYNQHSADFRRTAAQLQMHAKQKNIDAAALDYVLLTTNCVNCHKYVRQHQKQKK